ncbi:hypothetical protein AB0M57_04640 [Streptomyces sp. NPDC051597]
MAEHKLVLTIEAAGDVTPAASPTDDSDEAQPHHDEDGMTDG